MVVVENDDSNEPNNLFQENKLIDKTTAVLIRIEFKQMVDDMPINVLVADLSTFEITYANTSSVETLKTLEHVLPCKETSAKRVVF